MGLCLYIRICLVRYYRASNNGFLKKRCLLRLRQTHWHTYFTPSFDWAHGTPTFHAFRAAKNSLSKNVYRKVQTTAPFYLKKPATFEMNPKLDQFVNTAIFSSCNKSIQLKYFKLSSIFLYKNYSLQKQSEMGMEFPPHLTQLFDMTGGVAKGRETC